MQYKRSSFAVTCLSYGYIVVISFNPTGKGGIKVLSHSKFHKGNITSACFVNDSEFLVTASGSFSKNHDNSIVVSKVTLAMEELFLKKTSSFSSAHGKHKGVMCVKSTNLKSDYLITSCGNEDDPSVKFWDTKDQSMLQRYVKPNPEARKPYYYLNLVYLNSEDEELKLQGDSDDKIQRGFITVAASIKSLDFYLKNPFNTLIQTETCSIEDDIGSYLAPMTTIKHNDTDYSILVSNVNGNIDVFSLKFENDLSKESLDYVSSEGKDKEGDNEAERIAIESQINVLELIEKARNKELSLTEPSLPQGDIGVAVPSNEEVSLTPRSLQIEEKEANDFEKAKIGQAEGGDLSGIDSQPQEAEDFRDEEAGSVHLAKN